MASALAVLAMSCSTASGQAVTGLEPGVHIDPGSPAAKEYALPLNQGRQTGASLREGSPAAALFGAGIHSRGGSGGGSSAGESSHRGSTGGGVAPANVPRTRAAIPAVVLRSAGGRASSGGGGSILALVGGGVAILVLGGFGGMVLRRIQRAAPLV
jgi:hypothetical protein